MGSVAVAQTVAAVAAQGILYSVPKAWVGGLSRKRLAFLVVVVLIVGPSISLLFAGALLALPVLVLKVGVCLFVAVCLVHFWRHPV